MDTPVVQHHNAIGIHHARDALGDDDHGRIGNLCDVLADLGVGRHIDRAGGVVKNEHARMLEQRARDAQALLLSARNTGAALAQLAVQPADAVQELVHTRRAAGTQQLLVGGIGCAPLQVFAHGARKQHVLLQHNAHGIAQGNQVVVAHVTPAHEHGALGRVVQARDELHERALARARAAEHAHRGARLNTKVDMLEHVLGSIRAVLKRHVAELNASVGNLAHGRVCRGCLDERLLVNHSRNALHAGERAREQQKHVGDHHERVHDQQHVAHKARERAHAQLAGDNHAPADPQDGDGGHIHRQLKHRQVEHGVTEGLRRRVRELGIDGVELGLLVLGAHIRLDGAHGGEVLLHHAVEVVHRDLQLTVKRTHAVGDDAQHDRQHGQDNREDRGERARQHQGIDQADDERHRSAHHGTKAVADGVLDDGDVGGHAGDKRAGVVVVQVAKGERLDLAILGLAQVGTQARGHTGGRAGIAQAQHQRKRRAHQHARAL